MNAMLLLAALAVPHSAARAQCAEPRYLVSDFDWLDHARLRLVPARLYWPAAPLAGKPVPLVVFSHGIGGSREGYSYLGRHWSARGVACLHVQHVGSDAALWRGNPFGVIGRLQAAAQEQEAIARAADVRFALDRMLSVQTGDLGAMVDRQRIVAAGHSYGANTTLLTVGAQVVREGRTIDCLDSRFSAALVISAPPFYGEADLAAVMSNVAVPTLHVTATDDVIEIPGYHSGVEDRLAIFNAIAHPHKLLAVFRGGAHSMFTDRLFPGGWSLNAKVKLATADLALAFLDLIFERDGAALLRWEKDWQPILAQPPRPEAAPRIMLTGGAIPVPPVRAAAPDEYKAI
ncbi:acetylhydrolase [Azoarcus indigens]|uniref:Putative dienelactone hydrolase n=2 Tax=Azoarcus indigens TaxID=29545 RepID=A0A4R6DWB2_9RHOO|nr:acetylhydrolase [Azoarcus indigens]TDN49576.1 putative dienelactone hydrolase [Azoarcus indigens]